MLTRPFAVVVMAGFGVVPALPQDKAMLDTPRQVNSPAPPAPVSLEMRGDIYMARKEFREALDTYAQGPAKDPILRNKMGIAYHQMLELDRARKCYEEAIKLNPDYIEVINNLGTVYYAKKSFRHAISSYNRALKLD